MLMKKRVSGLIGVMAIAAVSPALMAQDPPAPAGKNVMEQRCHACHELTTITARRGSTEEWREIVQRMVSYGAQVTEPEQEELVGYLSKTYGSDQAGSAPAH